jgi:hypothetical protein
MNTGHVAGRHAIVVLGTVLALGASGTARAQGLTPPVEGTVALDQTVQQEYTGAHFVIVKTMAGFGHVGRFTKGLFVHRSPASGNNGTGPAQNSQTVAVSGRTR